MAKPKGDDTVGAIEFFVKVKGHYDFDVSDPSDVKLVYLARPTVIKTVLSEEGIVATMAERGVPRNRAIEDLFVEGTRSSVRTEDIVSISCDQPGPLERVASLYGVRPADLGDKDMTNPRHVKALEVAEVTDTLKADRG